MAVKCCSITASTITTTTATTTTVSPAQGMSCSPSQVCSRWYWSLKSGVQSMIQ
jgi:hypothetical protein